MAMRRNSEPSPIGHGILYKEGKLRKNNSDKNLRVRWELLPNMLSIEEFKGN